MVLLGDLWMTKDWTGEVLGAEVRGLSEHPSLCLGLIGHAWGWGMMDCHFPWRRGISVWGRGECWQRAKRQQRLRQVLSLFCLNLAVLTALKCSLDTQPSSLLWSCTKPKEEAFVPVWHQHICLETFTLFDCYHRDSEPDTSRVAKATTAKFLCHVISDSGAPATRLPLLGLVGHRGESVGFPQRWLLSLK